MKEEIIPVPFRFNPLKHHLSWIKDFIAEQSGSNGTGLIREIRHIGNSVMDVYTGSLSINEIVEELYNLLSDDGLLSREYFSIWAGTGFSDFRQVILSDSSQWILKYHADENRYVHFFPARSSPHTFRVKANTLKSAVLYIVLNGKDYVNDEDLNNVRSLAGLSPVKEIAETEAISGMIEILRNL